jgi:hypothetical protein
MGGFRTSRHPDQAEHLSSASTSSPGDKNILYFALIRADGDRSNSAHAKAHYLGELANETLRIALLRWGLITLRARGT